MYGEKSEKNIIFLKGVSYMNTLVLLLICTAILACGYTFYGRWLCKQWGVDETNSTPTPAHTMT
ncbi:MAG: hypothetical protein IIW64_11790, partial [Selenomonadaceae bacterium]|nr:hypothetical protein [Selenomonadaceae bacterium]MBQ5920225.1 hypothetical protein [Selenomonadaceae bacterium]